MNNIYRKIIPLLCLALLTAGWAALPAQARGGARKLSPLSDSLRKAVKAPSRERRAAFNKFAGRHGRNWRVRYNPRTALPEALTGGKAAGYAGTPEQAAAAFFAANKDLLGVDPSALELRLKKEFSGVTHLQYQQYKDGLPVEFSYARVHVTASGAVLGYQAKFEPELTLNTSPVISADAATAAARAHLGRNLGVSRTELVVYPDETDGKVKLAWKVRGRAGGLWVYYVDAHTGAVLFSYDDLRYACNNNAYYFTRGTSSATVYAVSPMPTYVADPLNVTEDNWTQPVKASLRDQYVWVADYSSKTVTNASGDYCAQKDGKMFSSLKGPYFSVSNFRGASAHFDNGGGQWRTYTHSVASPHPYANSQTYDYSVTIPNDWGPNNTFAKAMPGFSSFNVGDLDIYGSLNDPDLVRVGSGGRTEGVYIGNRTTAFYGAAVESPSYGISLVTDQDGTSTGFTVNKSSYLVLTNAPNSASNATGMVVWSTYTAGVYMDKSIGDVNALSEVNAFYHLNAIRRYFDPLNTDLNTGAQPANLSRHVPVMVHAHGNADRMGQVCPIGDDNCGGMQNAYYDLENDNIMLGDGQVDYFGKYRSFALDGTIVRHEYIHLVIDRIFPIINFGEFGAISEGLSDYFSLASFWREGETITALGTYVGAGEGAARDISGPGVPTTERKMPDDWHGEVHEDGLMLSQALYKLRRGPAQYNLDNGESAFNYGGNVLPRADIFAFAALFYFPDNFANFKDAMLDACRQLDAPNCDTAMQAKIQNAFSYHGIGGDGDAVDEFEDSGSSAMCRSNNGPECASDVGSRTSLSATIYPLGDVDYYGIPVAAGAFAARLDLPATAQEGTYKAYSMLLFDSDRNIAVRPDGSEAIAIPEVYNNYGGYCPDSGDCLTLSPSVELTYTVPYGGRYYLVVSGGLNSAFGNSDVNSLTPYTLNLARVPAGSAAAGIYSAAFDGDDISFSVPFSRFDMNVSPSSAAALDLSVTGTTEQSSAEFVFEYAQLRDHNYEPLADTKTNVPAPLSYLQRVSGSLSTNVDSAGRDVLTGRVRLRPGFAARYPGVGTVYLEIFGRNHLGHVVSLGVSNAVNLASNRSGLTAYNNILTGGGDAAIIKYEVQSAGNLSVRVYTQSGALVKTVFNGPVPAGKGTVDWDGTNSNGGKAASGIYFVKSKGPGLDKVVKVAIVR